MVFLLLLLVVLVTLVIDGGDIDTVEHVGDVNTEAVVDVGDGTSVECGTEGDHQCLADSRDRFDRVLL